MTPHTPHRADIAAAIDRESRDRAGMSTITEDEVQQAWREARAVWKPWRLLAAGRWTVQLPPTTLEPIRHVTFSRLTRRDARGQLHVLAVRGGIVLEHWPADDDEAPAAVLATGCL